MSKEKPLSSPTTSIDWKSAPVTDISIISIINGIMAEDLAMALEDRDYHETAKVVRMLNLTPAPGDPNVQKALESIPNGEIRLVKKAWDLLSTGRGLKYKVGKFPVVEFLSRYYLNENNFLKFRGAAITSDYEKTTLGVVVRRGSFTVVSRKKDIWGREKVEYKEQVYDRSLEIILRSLPEEEISEMREQLGKLSDQQRGPINFLLEEKKVPSEWGDLTLKEIIEMFVKSSTHIAEAGDRLKELEELGIKGERI